MDSAALRQSWGQFSAAGPEAAKYFYATLFVVAPEARSMFPTNMQYQEDKLLAALGHIITSLDDPEALAVFAQRLGADHRRFHGRDQRGHPVVLGERHYIWVGQALLATLERFLGPYFTPALRAQWAAAYELVAKLMLEGAAEAERTSPPHWEAEVLTAERRRADIVVFTVRPNYLCAYRPGQSLPVQVPQLRTWRYLSPANAPRADGTIEFHVRATGRFSTHLVRRLRAGESLLLGHPTGTALASYDRAPQSPLLLIAGGTGLAPLRAVAEAVQQGTGRRTTLVVGGRTPDDLYDEPALSRLVAMPAAGGHGGGAGWLRYVPTVESGWGWRGAVGRAGDTALRLGPWADTEVLVCGSPEMTRETVTMLVRSGVEPDRILTESYDHSRYPPLAEAAAGVVRDFSGTGAR
ncbi:globin domain-containing protein [Micromonospora rifamycinica]|uniref:nitric oxide dioxygenase n=1 Tax=Micromonospora rifamycinica TaxID=291594 RepID=A0A109IIB0_9ACTN|nr:globin domain-containing protein [Micromonospora rifamycinica]KWV31079.1 oxidoreductase [Micromonospora rifamycinica]SCG40827.1 NAD(P)H-flavin reductase [Micromonospora rifamycinica]